MLQQGASSTIAYFPQGRWYNLYSYALVDASSGGMNQTLQVRRVPSNLVPRNLLGIVSTCAVPPSASLEWCLGWSAVQCKGMLEALWTTLNHVVDHVKLETPPVLLRRRPPRTTRRCTCWAVTLCPSA